MATDVHLPEDRCVEAATNSFHKYHVHDALLATQGNGPHLPTSSHCGALCACVHACMCAYGFGANTVSTVTLYLITEGGQWQT